jgi:hypothetical protein
MNKRPHHIENPDWKKIGLRLQGDVMRELEDTCIRLHLEKSEVARRCIAVGLKSFKDVELPGTLPGSRWEKKTDEAADR